jgi:hypothetical protein
MSDSEQNELIMAIKELTKELKSFKDHVVLWRSLDQQGAKEKEAKSLHQDSGRSDT